MDDAGQFIHGVKGFFEERCWFHFIGADAVAMGNDDFDITPSVENKEEEKEQKVDPVEELDILDDKIKTQESVEESSDLTPLVSFFEDRIKKGYFSPLVDEEGNDVPLTKPEDVDCSNES